MSEQMQTHFHGCWLGFDHHACAVRKIGELQTENQRLRERERELEEAEQRAEQYNLELTAENHLLRETLRQIADSDYRGNRSTEQVLAYKILEGLDE